MSGRVMSGGNTEENCLKIKPAGKIEMFSSMYVSAPYSEATAI